MSAKIKDLKTGDSAVITGYEAGCNYYRQKLLSMGLIKGTKITLLKTAPLGDPVQLELRGFKLSLRKKEADILILDTVESRIIDFVENPLAGWGRKWRNRRRGCNRIEKWKKGNCNCRKSELR